MHDAYTVKQAHCLKLEVELSNIKYKIQKDDHIEMIKRFSNLEIDLLNLQLKYQYLKEHFGNNKPQPSQDTPEFDTVFEINKMKASLQGKDNVLRKAENEKVKQHYKELYDSIKITRAKTIEKTTSLLTKNEKLKAQLKGKMQCVTMPTVKPKVLAPGFPRLKFEKDHLCSACKLRKSQKYSHKPKSENTNLEVLNTIHMDLCGLMRVQTINGKKYILVIVDDYSRFTWVKFLRSKDETSESVIKFLKQIQVGLNKTVRYIRTDNGTEFVNQVLTEYYERVGIFHQKSVPRTPQQNGVVKRRNRTRVEAARTMLIFSKAPMFLWAEVDPSLFLLTPGQISSGLVPDIVPASPYVPPANKDLEILFQPMLDKYFKPPGVERLVPPAPAVQVPIISASTPSSTTIDQDAPSTSYSPSSSVVQPTILHQGVAAGPTIELTTFPS
ncbi:retrovirus-related pol polyprotein from transposon TNT 1-94 [Tanacetum coccineum]